VDAVGAAVWEQGAASVRRCYVSTLVVGAAYLLVSVAGGGWCACFPVIAGASALVLVRVSACASVTLIVTQLALLVLGAAVVVALYSAYVHVVGTAAVEKDVVHVPHCHVWTLVVDAACLFVRMWVCGVSLCFFVDRTAVFFDFFPTSLRITVLVSPPTSLVKWTCSTRLMTF